MGKIHAQKVADLRVVVETSRKIGVTPRETIAGFGVYAMMGFPPAEASKLIVGTYEYAAKLREVQ